jgi:predicted phosphodiesterase
VERIAVLSDVHGNLTALEAVLNDIADRGIRRIFNLGDTVGKGPRGSAAVDICAERCEVNVQGNWDAWLPGPDAANIDGAVSWWRDELRADQHDWLSNLPFCHNLTVSGRRMRFFHASADSVGHRVRVVHTDEEFVGMFENTDATGHAAEPPTVVAYGDIHDVYLKVRDGRTLFNVGAVGNALDEPTAPYVIIEGVPDSEQPGPFGLHVVRVPYDIDAEIAVARKLDAPEVDAYERELRDGVYRGRPA